MRLLLSLGEGALIGLWVGILYLAFAAGPVRADDVVVTPCRSGVPTYGFYDYHSIVTTPNNGTPEVYNGVVLVGCYATQNACDQARTAYPNGTVSQPVGSPQVGVMSYAHNHSACFLMQD